jgi:hypothetical protein
VLSITLLESCIASNRFNCRVCVPLEAPCTVKTSSHLRVPTSLSAWIQSARPSACGQRHSLLAAARGIAHVSMHLAVGIVLQLLHFGPGYTIEILTLRVACLQALTHLESPCSRQKSSLRRSRHYRVPYA